MQLFPRFWTLDGFVVDQVLSVHPQPIHLQLNWRILTLLPGLVLPCDLVHEEACSCIQHCCMWIQLGRCNFSNHGTKADRTNWLWMGYADLCSFGTRSGLDCQFHDQVPDSAHQGTFYSHGFCQTSYRVRFYPTSVTHLMTDAILGCPFFYSAWLCS